MQRGAAAVLLQRSLRNLVAQAAQRRGRVAAKCVVRMAVGAVAAVGGRRARGSECAGAGAENYPTPAEHEHQHRRRPQRVKRQRGRRFAQQWRSPEAAPPTKYQTTTAEHGTRAQCHTQRVEAAETKCLRLEMREVRSRDALPCECDGARTQVQLAKADQQWVGAHRRRQEAAAFYGMRHSCGGADVCRPVWKARCPGVASLSRQHPVEAPMPYGVEAEKRGALCYSKR